MKIPAGSCLMNSVPNRLLAHVEYALAAINTVAEVKEKSERI